MEPANCTYCPAIVYRDDKGRLVEWSGTEPAIPHACEGLRMLAEFDADPFPLTLKKHRRNLQQRRLF